MEKHMALGQGYSYMSRGNHYKTMLTCSQATALLLLSTLLPVAIHDCVGAASSGRCMESCGRELTPETAARSCCAGTCTRNCTRSETAHRQHQRSRNHLRPRDRGALDICSLGITAPGRLQEGCEGWGRRAMDGYRGRERNWERETGSVTSHKRKQGARKSILGNLKIRSFTSSSLPPLRVSVLGTEKYEIVQRDSDCAYTAGPRNNFQHQYLVGISHITAPQQKDNTVILPTLDAKVSKSRQQELSSQHAVLDLHTALNSDTRCL